MTSPAPLTPLQKRIVLILTVGIALTRLLAVARSMCDWDEGLFSLAVREYDVAVQHPHPPGYPLFIAAAKLFHLLGIGEFRSLQCVVVLGAFCVFPALFWFARELGFSFATAAGGAAIFAFLPNVWVYGGTGFSDVPATAIGFVACAFLLRGRRSKGAYVLGAVVLGIAAGFRPPNLLIGALPALLATWHRLRARDWGAIVLALVLGGAVASASYGGAIMASESFDAFMSAVHTQSEWVRKVDSWHNPTRPPLPQVAKQFFVVPCGPKPMMLVLAALSLIALTAAAIQRRAAPWLLLATYVPYAVVAWLNLDINTASRYAIAYVAVHGLLAADGLGVIGRRDGIQAALSTILVGVFVAWTWPALQVQRTTDAPPAGALQWVGRNVAETATVYVHGSYGPQSAFLLPRHHLVYYDTHEEIGLLSGDAWIVDFEVQPGAMNFVRPRNSLFSIIRRRGFEASILRSWNLVHFGEGWYDEERGGNMTWRWMSRDARAELPPLRGSGRLSLRLYVPLDALRQPPTIEIWLNGSLIGRFAGTPEEVSKSWVVASRHDRANELRITTSDAVVPARSGKSQDSRELGLRVDALSWTPVK